MANVGFSFGLGFIPGYSLTEIQTTTETGYISTKVYPLFYSKIIIEWAVPPSWGSCLFNVYRGDTEVGPWVKLNPAPLSGTNFLEDTLSEDFSIFHRGYYIVEVQLPAPDGRRIKSPMVTWENKRGTLVEIRAKEITRREKVLLSKFTGIDTLIFRRKYFGERCPECYNLDIEKVTKDHCLTCLGTSFKGGYFPGMLTKVCYDVSPNNTQMSYQGKIESNSTTAWTTSFPDIMVHDLLLRIPDSRIFRVEANNATELQTVQVRQVLSIVEKDKNSVETTLLKTITPTRYL